MEGHLFAPVFEHPDYEPPAIVLLVSGGHSQLVHVKAWGDYTILGETIDDAAGEAFDKLARVMGLGFPGGPAIDNEAEGGDPNAIKFPRALMERRHHFSFSGLKTSVITYLQQNPGNLPPRADVAASVQEAIVDVLIAKTLNAVEDTGVRRVAAGGGVVANTRLRSRLAQECAERGIALHLPSPELATDNGAMIGAAAVHWLERGAITSWEATVDAGKRL
jgi:N6-L-threonylcarbamoyladenine synthase